MTSTLEQIKTRNNHIVKIWGEIKELDKQELLHLLASYEEYVRQIVEENEGQPVCLAEFYEWDYLSYFKDDFKSDILEEK